MLEMAPEEVKQKRKEALEARQQQEEEKNKNVRPARNAFHIRASHFSIRVNDPIELSSGDESEFSTDEDSFGVYTSEWGCYGTCFICGDSSHNGNSCPHRRRNRR